MHVGVWYLISRPALALHDDALVSAIQHQIDATVIARRAPSRPDVLDAVSLLFEIAPHQSLELKRIHLGQGIAPTMSDGFIAAPPLPPLHHQTLIDAGHRKYGPNRWLIRNSPPAALPLSVR